MCKVISLPNQKGGVCKSATTANLGIGLASYGDTFSSGAASATPLSDEQIRKVSLNELYEFDGHPFQVRQDEAMTRLVKSIEKLGVLDAAIVRTRQEGGYEMITGHRRKRACEIAGLTEMPVIIRNLDDDTATLIMVDSNLEQRETLLPSEKAWAYRMKLTALNHRGERPDVPSRLSVDILTEQTGESKNQIFRFIRLTELVPGLIDMVDDKKIAFNPAVELSYLTRKEQTILLDAMAKHETTPSLSQAQRLKKLSQAGELTPREIDIILSTPKNETDKVTLKSDKLKQYFPATYTPRQMEDVIFKLLKGWRSRWIGQE